MAGETEPLDIYRVNPPGARGTLESLTCKVERLMRDHTREFDRIMAQYDQILSRSNISPESALKALEAKARILTNMSDNGTRIALAIERERRAMEEKNRTSAINKASAVRLIETQRKAQKAASTIDVSSQIVVPCKPPKVKMYSIGTKFVATVGVDRIEDEDDLPEPA